MKASKKIMKKNLINIRVIQEKIQKIKKEREKEKQRLMVQIIMLKIWLQKLIQKDIKKHKNNL